MSVSDQYRSLDKRCRSVFLLGLRERAALVGGVLVAGNVADLHKETEGEAHHRGRLRDAIALKAFRRLKR